MGRFQIHCRVHDSQERVVEVGIGNQKFSKDQVWNWIEGKAHSFFTNKGGFAADVIAAERSGYRYLTTAADRVTDNNLDELPKCY